MSPGQSPSYLVNKEQRRLFAQKSAEEGTLFKGVLREGADDLLLTEEKAVYTVLRTHSLHQPPLTDFLPPGSPVMLYPFFSSLQNPSLISPSLPAATPIFLQTLALFDWSPSLDSLSCIQVKLLIASAVGGLRRWLSAAQLVPAQGIAGWSRRAELLCSIGVCLQTAPGDDKDLLIDAGDDL